MREIQVEDILPFAFPFDIGGPKMERHMRVSSKASLQKYMRVAVHQFMRGDPILVLNHMFGHISSYRSGVMTCRSIVGSILIGRLLSGISVDDLWLCKTDDNPSDTSAMEHITKAVSTSCCSLNHTTKAAKHARKLSFAMMDHFGVNSLFLTITSCDECNFRVRLYCNLGKQVSTE
jgi:hypothetical protein